MGDMSLKFKSRPSIICHISIYDIYWQFVCTSKHTFFLFQNRQALTIPSREISIVFDRHLLGNLLDNYNIEAAILYRTNSDRVIID